MCLFFPTLRPQFDRSYQWLVAPFYTSSLVCALSLVIIFVLVKFDFDYQLMKSMLEYWVAVVVLVNCEFDYQLMK